MIANLEASFVKRMRGIYPSVSNGSFIVRDVYKRQMSPNVRKKRTYDDLDYGMLDKTLDISAVSFHKMIQSAKKLNAIADYGLSLIHI